MSSAQKKDNSGSLYAILFRQTPIVSVTLPKKLPFKTSVGWLSMVGSTLVQFENVRDKRRTKFHISDRRLRNIIGTDKQSIWRVCLKNSLASGAEADLITEAEYTLERYRFPRVIPWIQDLPFYVPEPLRKEWSAILRGGQLRERLVFSQNKMLLGMSLVGNFETDDERAVSIWTNTGEVLICEVEEHYLRLKRLVTISDREELSFHPNTLLNLDDVNSHISLREVQQNEKVILPNSLEPLLPVRSFVMKAWTKYQALLRDEREQRYIAREKYKLFFQNATPTGEQWQMNISCTEEEIIAWMGENIKNGQTKDINEPILMYRDESEEIAILGNPTLKRMKKVSQTKIRAWVQLPKGRIPSAGMFKITVNKGSQTKNEREREAFLRLSAGTSLNSKLLEIIGSPKVASPPKSSGLPILERQEGFPPDDIQSEAIRKMFHATDVVAIQGPPGTGKTKIIVQLLQYLTERANRRKEPLKVLVSSVQNEAVYGVVQRLVATGDIAIHYVEKQQFNEKSDSEWQIKMEGHHTACLNRLKSSLNEKVLAEEETLKRIMNKAHRCIGQLVSFHTLSLSMRTRLFEALDGFQTSVLSTLRKEDLHNAVRALESSLETRAGLVEPPQDWTKLSSWVTENEEGLPIELRSDVHMSVRRIDRFGKRNRIEQLEQEYHRLYQLIQPFLSQQSTPNMLINGVIKELKRIFDFCDERCEKLYQTKDGILLDLYRSVQNLSAFKTLYKKYSTAVAATTSRSGKDQDEYDVVIIDEAGRAAPLELFIPMVQGRKIILIGDHRQLPPVVDEQIWKFVDGEASNPPSQINLFTDFFKNLPDECTHRLSTQYRSHPDIVDIINRVYYKPHNESIHSFFAERESISPNFPFDWNPETSRKSSSLHRTVPLDIFNRRGVVWQDVPSHQCSYVNQNEIDRIEEILQDIEVKLHVFRERLQEYPSLGKRYSMYAKGELPVAIIVPYSKQREKIESMLLRNPTFKDFVQVCTIDAVQGREYPIVLFSFVRSDGRAGFLASPNRMNVAISRAQHQIVLIGNRSALTTSKIKKRAKELSRLLGCLDSGERK